jgi:hypothetical protein
VHRRLRLLAAALTVAAALLAACGGDDAGGASASSTSPPASVTAAPATLATTTRPATTPPTTTAPTAAAPTTIAAAPATSAVAPSPTDAPPAAGNPFTGDEVEVASELFANPFVMRRAAESGGFVAYDGAADAGGFTMRCTVVVRPGDAGWWEACREPDVSAAYVVIDGIDPWIVDVGPELGEVTLTPQPFDWAITSSGCREPVVSIATAAELAPAMTSGLWCVGTEALLTHSAVFLQPGPVDGGFVLLSNGDEGWNWLDRGTSLDCAAIDDGIDRCALFDVDGELFGGHPVPPAEAAAAQVDAIGVADEADAIRAIAGDATDVDTVVDRIVAALSPADAEVAPTVTQLVDAGWSEQALVVEVPAMDDSILATVHHVWITPPVDGRGVNVAGAYTWQRCARGVAGPDLCL